MTTEWPRGAGRTITFPEVDRCAWFTAVSARGKINAAQAELITGREAALDSGSSS
jgi:predicted NUDIX family NTP pyrophosphohydrolase